MCAVLVCTKSKFCVMECQWETMETEKFRSPWLDGFYSNLSSIHSHQSRPHRLSMMMQMLENISFLDWWFCCASFVMMTNDEDDDDDGIKNALLKEKHMNRILKRNQRKLRSRIFKLFSISSRALLMEWWMVNRLLRDPASKKRLKLIKPRKDFETATGDKRVMIADKLRPRPRHCFNSCTEITSNQDRRDSQLMIGFYLKSTKLLFDFKLKPSTISYEDFLTPLSPLCRWN